MKIKIIIKKKLFKNRKNIFQRISYMGYNREIKYQENIRNKIWKLKSQNKKQEYFFLGLHKRDFN